MKMIVKFYSYFLVFLSTSVEADNILVLSPITSPSHTNFFKPVVKQLVDRGHSVTYWNGLELAGFESKGLRLLYSHQIGEIISDHQMRFSGNNPFQLFIGFSARLETYCKAIYRDPVFQQLLDSKERYDLIVIEGILNECVLPLVEIFNVPFIYMVGIAPPPWLLDAVGSPLALDHFPLPIFSFTDQMNLWQRTLNTLSGLMMIYYRNWVFMPVVDRAAGQMLANRNLKAVREIESHYLNLVIVNTHFSLNYQLPKTWAVVEAGGLHCGPAKPLSQDLEAFVNNGDDGFIIVSFGSILRGIDIPLNVRRIFLAAFARLPQRVVWKWENQSRFDDDPIPANVKLLSWLPQQDLLAHPKARLFITHGGLFSIQEAVYHGVPFIALPVFADQPINAQKAHDDGYAIRLDWDDLTEEIVFNTIQLMLHNPKYARKMEEVSTLMRDQIVGPLDRAVFWIEYVIRHGGSRHLRPASRELSLHQRGLVDVMLLLFLFFAWLFFMALRLYRLLLASKTRRRVPMTVTKSKKTKNDLKNK